MDIEIRKMTKDKTNWPSTVKLLFITLLFSIAFLLSTVDTNAATGTNISIMHGWNGTAFAPLQIDSDGRLKTNINLTRSVGIHPDTDNLRRVGSPNNRWGVGYFANLVAAGNTDMGAVTPSFSLTVVGDLNVSNGNNGITPNSNAAEAIFEKSGSNGGISILSSDAYNGTLLFGSASDNFGSFLSWHYNDKLLRLGTTTASGELSFSTALSSEAARFDASGNFGIGTTNPTKLFSVNGTAYALTIDPSATNPTINTTDRNLTISSFSGSIIMQLG